MINFCALQSAWRGAPRFFLRLEDILKWTGKNACLLERLLSGRRPNEDAGIAGKESQARSLNSWTYFSRARLHTTTS